MLDCGNGCTRGQARNTATLKEWRASGLGLYPPVTVSDVCETNDRSLDYGGKSFQPSASSQNLVCDLQWRSPHANDSRWCEPSTLLTPA